MIYASAVHMATGPTARFRFQLKEEGTMERDRIRTESGRAREDDVEGTAPDRNVDVERRDATSWSGTRDPLLASHFDFMGRFMREMGRMFESFPGGGGSNYSMNRWPPIEVFERDNRVVVRAEMPGMRHEDVKVSVDGDSLVIEGERKDDREVRHEGHYESEWSYGRFSRRVTLPVQVDPEHVKARYDNGILEVWMDVPARARREIPIAHRESRPESPLRAAIDNRSR
jgi:HSP20 family protein